MRNSWMSSAGEIGIEQAAGAGVRRDGIAEDILSRSAPARCAVLNEAADNGCAVFVAVFQHRIGQRRVGGRIGVIEPSFGSKRKEPSLRFHP